MVDVYGNRIVEAHTNGTLVTEIYTYGEKVWPPEEYYVRWSPSDISGSFVMAGEARWLQAYSGYYTGPFSSTTLSDYGRIYYIDRAAFLGTEILGVETNIQYISDLAFASISTLQYAILPNCFRLGTNPMGGIYTGVFESCSSLYYVELPKCEYIGRETFANCKQLKYINLPECEYILYYAFYGCTNLIDVSIPKCIGLTNHGVFAECTQLESIVIPSGCSILGYSLFKNCTKLSTIYFEYSGVVSITKDDFYGTPINALSGSIYVPLEWVSEYKRSYPGYSNIILPIPYSN